MEEAELRLANPRKFGIEYRNMGCAQFDCYFCEKETLLLVLLHFLKQILLNFKTKIEILGKSGQYNMKSTITLKLFNSNKFQSFLSKIWQTIFIKKFYHCSQNSVLEITIKKILFSFMHVYRLFIELTELSLKSH